MPLPFDLPTLSRAFAELTPGARATGAEVARAAAAELAAIVGGPVTVEARVVPGRPAPAAIAARVAVDLAALPAPAVLEVEPALVVAISAALAGDPAAVEPAATLTPVEATLLELLVLSALHGACSVAGIDAALAPRLARGVREPAGALSVELAIEARGARGRARLLLPPAAVRALAGRSDAGRADIVLPLSLRRGAAALGADDLAALAAGDVLVLDLPEGPSSLVLPGGARAHGRLEDDHTFHVEETTMSGPPLQLPVKLEVELATVELPLAELARLEPGAVLPLRIDRRGLVTLRAGERAVARGELVDVDGAVGVRVLSVEGAP